MRLLSRRRMLTGAGIAGAAGLLTASTPTPTAAKAGTTGSTMDQALIDEKIGDLATIEELTHGTALIAAPEDETIGAYATSAPLFIAPFPCEIAWVALTVHRLAGVCVPANDSSYWTVQVRRFRGDGSSVVVAQKTTKASGGQAITYRVPWTFDAVPLDPASRVLQAGDTVDVAFVPTGSPPALGRPVYGQMRYRPL
ncbi:hypothetical protein ACI797_15425 [Geodermatophilus sp. SYSU D00691]